MKISAIAAGLAAGTLVIGVAGCGSDKSPAPSSTPASSSASTSSAPSSAPSSSSAAAQPGDYSGLLIKPTDIVVPNDTFTLTQTLPVPNPAGVEGVFMNPGGSRKVDDTIYVYPDAAQAGRWGVTIRVRSAKGGRVAVGDSEIAVPAGSGWQELRLPVLALPAGSNAITLRALDCSDCQVAGLTFAPG